MLATLEFQDEGGGEGTACEFEAQMLEDLDEQWGVPWETGGDRATDVAPEVLCGRDGGGEGRYKSVEG